MFFSDFINVSLSKLSIQTNIHDGNPFLEVEGEIINVVC